MTERTTPVPPVVNPQLLIRRPAPEVYEAFVDPAITTQFWFTDSTGRLEPGATVTWSWAMYGVSAPVRVTSLVPNERILVEWGDPPAPVEWTFQDRGDGTTLVKVASWGFTGSPDEIVAKAIDAMGGFTSMLAGAKAWLEHGLDLRLVADHHPDAHVDA